MLAVGCCKKNAARELGQSSNVEEDAPGVHATGELHQGLNLQPPRREGSVVPLKLNSVVFLGEHIDVVLVGLLINM